MIANVVRLTRYLGKGAPGESLPVAHLVRELGMEGNHHQGGSKQICLLTAAARRWMDAQAQPGLCFRRFRENILIEGIASGELVPGTFLRIGDAVLEISIAGKHCFEECALFEHGIPCLLRDSAAFAVVKQGGIIHVGEPLVATS